MSSPYHHHHVYYLQEFKGRSSGKLLEAQDGMTSHFKQVARCLAEVAISSRGVAQGGSSLAFLVSLCFSGATVSYMLHFNDLKKTVIRGNISNFTLKQTKAKKKKRKIISLGSISAKVPTRLGRIFI